MNIPEDAGSLDSKTLSSGVSTLIDWSEANSVELDLCGISWRLVAAQIEDGDDNKAAQTASTLDIRTESHLDTALNLLVK